MKYSIKSTRLEAKAIRKEEVELAVNDLGDSIYNLAKVFKVDKLCAFTNKIAKSLEPAPYVSRNRACKELKELCERDLAHEIAELDKLEDKVS